MGNKKILIVLLICILCGVAAFFLYNHFQAKAVSGVKANVVSASGTLEVTEIDVSSEAQGKIESLPIKEGDTVKRGELLAIVNADSLKAQLLQAEGNLETAKAKLSAALAGARSEEIEQAQKAVEQAEAVLLGAKKALANTQAIYENRTAAKQQVDTAATQYNIAKKQYAAAKANLEQVLVSLANAKTNYDRAKDLYSREVISRQQYDNAETQYNMLLAQSESAKATLEQAKSGLVGAEKSMHNMEELYEDRTAQKQQVDNAETQVKVAKTNLEAARARLDLLLEGTRAEDIAALKAMVKQAEAAVELIKIQLNKTRIYAPVAGTIMTKNVEAGENVVLGTSIVTLGDIQNIWLKVYIPETQIGLVKLGQKVSVKVDSFPDKTFNGSVKEIASNAEFTPKNVQTAEERVNQVFAVKVLLANRDNLLKPGMPADAEIHI